MHAPEEVKDPSRGSRGFRPSRRAFRWSSVGGGNARSGPGTIALNIRCSLWALLAVAVPTVAQEGPSTTVTVSSATLFDLADRAREAGDYATAEAAYRALTIDPDVELRTEARFRLAMMLADKLGKPREAAVLLREILDEKPNAARVRIELARMQAQLGNLAAAERELRAAQATGLPPAVERSVRFYASSLSTQRRSGFNLELALAPDSNINRATRSETLGTVVGDFDLSEDARAHSGIGLSAQGQFWQRARVTRGLDLLARISAGGDFYRQSAFDDHAVSFELGPQFLSNADRLSVSTVTSWRWFGRQPYAFSWGANATYQHPLGRRGQIRIDASALRSDDRRNDLRDANRFALAIGVDRAFSARTGGGLRMAGQREAARDPGHSAASLGAQGYLFREMGQTTVVLSGGYSRLEADQRVSLYPRRRVDDRLTAGLSGTFRALTVGSFAPIVRVHYERNYSTVELYDYRRLAAEIGVTAAF
jgi:hypothetical protein